MATFETSPRYYGWRVAGAAHLGLMMGFALYACTFSVFVKPLAGSFGWSRETVAGGFGISALTAAIFSPLIGRWLDTHSSRALLLLSISVFGCSFLAMSALGRQVWQFYLTCFVIGAAGNVMQMGYTQIVSTWFADRRGLAIGVMLAGEGIGLILFPVATEKVIATLGWRSAYKAIAAVILTFSLPAALLYARARSHEQKQTSVEEQKSNTLLRDLGSYVFWIIAVVLFLDSISINGTLTHQVPLLTDRGLTAPAAALTVSVLGGSSLVGRLLTGWLLDRLRGSLLAFILLTLAGIGIVLLAHAATFPAACSAALLLGLGAGGTSSTTPYLLSRYFGLRGFSTLYGLTWTFYAIAGGAGPVLLGYMFDKTGSYTSTLMLLAALTVFGAALMLLLPSYRSSASLPLKTRSDA
jgi:MFS family permease